MTFVMRARSDNLDSKSVMGVPELTAIPDCHGGYPYRTSKGERPNVECHVVLYQNSAYLATDATTWDMHEQNNARTSPSIDSHAPFGHWTADDKQYSFSTPHQPT